MNKPSRNQLKGFTDFDDVSEEMEKYNDHLKSERKRVIRKKILDEKTKRVISCCKK